MVADINLIKEDIIFLLILVQLVFISSSFSQIKLENDKEDTLSFRSLVSNLELAYPIAEFKKRIFKKTFGLYVTPKSSPVQPERFTGYHTGVDVEYEDVTSDVPVYAIADGTVVLSRTVSGYGGVFMIRIKLNGLTHTILYGHIRPVSLPKVGQKVFKREKLALLGSGYSKETDGERRHLHFAILADDRIDLRGYVQAKAQLIGWIDPLSLYE